jgi:acetoin utilization deacetylase AcuC-like enzyme
MGIAVMAAAAGLWLWLAAAVTGADNRMMTTGFGFSAACLSHETGTGHVEAPGRVAAVRERLRGTGLLEDMAECSLHGDPLKWVESVHDAAYVRSVRESCESGMGLLDAPDTAICPRSYEAALAAVGVVLGAVDDVAAGRCRNAFCAVRPPGHHARADRAAGFCIFNNVAIAARYAQKSRGLHKVLIVDWDLHHGDGTQGIFWEDPSVLYFSVHEFPAYPGSGRREERGGGEGLGTTVNRPLEAGSGDAEYLAALRDALVRAADEFRPDIVLVSAGFDAHESDPLGHMKVTAAGFAEMTRLVKDIADRHCEGRLVSVLEGGYDLAGLADCAEAHVKALME